MDIVNDTDKLVVMDEEGLHIASREVAEKLEKKNLSASMVSALTGETGCAARWLAQTFVVSELVEQEPDNAARRGSLFHKVMEDLFALDPEERTLVAVRELTQQTLHSDEFVDLSENKDVIEWLRNAINSYYRMGADPTKVKIAEIVMEEGKDPKKGLEIFVKGQIGDTRREILGFIDRLVFSSKDDGSLIIEDWKGLALDTLLPTATGWTTMGEVQVGDEILGTNGETVKVINKSDVHNRPCYKVTFMDGSSVVCDNVHLWDIRTSVTKHSQPKNTVVNADELYKLWQENGRDYIQIRNPEIITAFTKKTYKISPYVLGAWLGDGRNRDAEITSGTQDAEEMHKILQNEWKGNVRLHKNGEGKAFSIVFDKPMPEYCVMGNKCKYETETNKKKQCQDCIDTIAKGKRPRDLGNNVGLTTLLKRANLTHNKHVPLEYLRGSVEQRTALLQGLMDTDGYWHPKRKRALFYTTTKALADAVAEIVVSLGVTPTIYRGENEHKGFYEVGFSPVGFNPFRLSRKADQVETHFENKKYLKHKALHRYIRSIEPVESVPTQCVKVDAENSLYLCGPLMTPTHNSGSKSKHWKSHTKSEEGWAEQRQQLIYTMLLRQKGFEVVGARLLYPVAQDVVKVDVHNESMQEKVIQDIEETDKKLDVMIENNTFEYKPSFLCAWCPIATMCPKAIIKPYAKMQDAFASQPQPDVLLKGIELR